MTPAPKPFGEEASLRREMVGMISRVAVVLVLVWLALDVTGVSRAADEILRHRYYALRGARQTTQRVILVAIDAPTVAVWGPPPWRADRLEAMLDAITRGKPAVVGVAGDWRLALGDRTAPRGVLIDGGTDAALTTRMLAAANVSTRRGGTNYVGARGLPMVSAAHVASGAVPSTTFAGKLVIVGVTAQPYAGSAVTPIGALAPAQDQAHALSSAVDGADLRVIPTWLHLLAMALVSIMGIVAARKGRWAMLVAIGIAIATFLLDYAMFATSVALVGATSMLVASLTAFTLERVRERCLIRRYVAELGLWTRQRLALESMRLDESDEQAYWHRVAGLAQLYLGSSSTIVAELSPHGSELELRAIHGTSAQLVAARVLDVRREPFLTPHAMQVPVWHRGFMSDDSIATLLVPLVVRRVTIGFWIINFEGRPREKLGVSHMELVRMLALELAMAIDRRKQQTPLAAPRKGLIDRIVARGPIADELGEIRQHVLWQTQHQQDLLTLGESMPFGVFIATMWGEIRYMNTAMKLLCTERGLDPLETGSLPDVLARLASLHPPDVYDYLRRFVQELAEIHLHGRDTDERAGHDFVLSWLKPPANGQADVEQLILVSALPRRLGEQRVREARAVMPIASDRQPDDAMTMRLPRMEALDEVAALGDSLVANPSDTARRIRHAVGTPTFIRPLTMLGVGPSRAATEQHRSTTSPAATAPSMFAWTEHDVTCVEPAAHITRPIPVAEFLVDFTTKVERVGPRR